MSSPVYYGSFNLNDNINYFVIQKPISTVNIAPTFFKIGRLTGMKKTGETINERTIKISVRVLGTDRGDLENKIDALQQAMNLRQQQLAMRTNDNRYYIADCVGIEGTLAPGQILSTVLALTFICYDPYGYSLQTSTYDTGDVQFTYNAPTSNYIYQLSFAAGGTAETYPVIRVTQHTPTLATTLTSQLNSGSAYTQISVAALPSALAVNDHLIIGTSPNKSVIVSTAAPAGATTVNVSSFTANSTYTVGTSVKKDLTMNSIQITQQTDNTILALGLPLPAAFGDYVDIYCDPYDNVNGYTAQVNGGPGLTSVGGVFPVVEPITTNFTFYIGANSQPTVDILFTYTSRWLS
jgi:predicted phage tail component-like protein